MKIKTKKTLTKKFLRQSIMDTLISEGVFPDCVELTPKQYAELCDFDEDSNYRFPRNFMDIPIIIYKGNKNIPLRTVFGGEHFINTPFGTSQLSVEIGQGD